MPERVPQPSPPARPQTDRSLDPAVDEPKTDPHLRVVLDREANKITLRSVLIAAGAVASGVVLGIIFIDNRVAAQTDAGVRVHEQRITTLEQQRREDKDELDQRLKRIEANANADHELALGTSQKLDRLLDRMNVPNPAPTPKDGGR